MCLRFLFLHVISNSNNTNDLSCSLPVLLLCAGNDNLHLLTSETRQQLRVDLEDFENNTRYAEYDNFTVADDVEKYKLVSLGAYSGTAG